MSYPLSKKTVPNAPKLVTFQDVKAVATSRVVEAKESSSKFIKIIKSQPIDVYLARLIVYFGWFIKKNDLTYSVHKYHIEKSDEERQEYDRACMEVLLSRKLLGLAYADLLLGHENCQSHHMKCGQTSNSDTLGDRTIFEMLLQFSYVFVWIGMGRIEQDTIKNEINRLVRTEAFITDPPNIGSRDKNSELSKGETKQLQLKMRQRSKIIEALLPSASEKSKYLFTVTSQKKKTQSPMKLYCPHKESYYERFLIESDNFDPNSIKVGIIGEPLYKFNPISLSPLDVETEEETIIMNSQSKTNVEKYLETKQLFVEQEEQLKRLQDIFDDEL